MISPDMGQQLPRALELANEAIQQVSVQKGVALVEVTRLVELDGSAFTSNVGLQIDPRRQGKTPGAVNWTPAYKPPAPLL